MAYWFHPIKNSVDQYFFDQFNEFVYTYYDIVSNSNWKDVILDQCYGNEQLGLNTFFEIFDLFQGNISMTSPKRIVLSFFDMLVLRQQEAKEKLGANFSEILKDTMELLKENVITNLRSDFDYILEQLFEKAETVPELKQLLSEAEAKTQ